MKMRIAIFTIAEYIFAVDTIHVRDFLPPKSMMKIPQNVSQFFNQVVQLDDGRFVHIVNTEKLLGIQNRPTNAKSMLMIVESTSPSMAFLVDEVVKLIDIQTNAVAEQMSLSHIPQEFIQGIVTHDELVAILLNMDAMSQALGSTPSNP